MSNFFRKNSYCADLDRTPDELVALARVPKSQRKLRFSGFIASTVNDYINRIALFIQTCYDLGKPPLQNNPKRAAVLVLEHLRRLHEQDCGFATLQATRSAINTWYTTHEKAPPRSQALLAFCYAARKGHRISRATPITPEQLTAMCRIAARTRPPLTACRDIAMLLVAFSSAGRPIELRYFCCEDVRWDPNGRGVVIDIPRSKGDQEGQGQTVTLPSVPSELCPVTALKRWLELSGITSGVVFRAINRHGTIGGDQAMSYEAYRKLLRYYLHAAGVTGKASGYSMRRGWATSARRHGASRAEIRLHLRHEREETTQIYIDDVPVSFEHSITRVMLT